MNPAQIQQVIVQHGMVISTTSGPSNVANVPAQSQNPVKMTSHGPQLCAVGVAGPQGTLPGGSTGDMPQGEVASVNVSAGCNVAPTQASFIRHPSPAPVPAVTGMPVQPQLVQQRVDMTEEVRSVLCLPSVCFEAFSLLAFFHTRTSPVFVLAVHQSEVITFVNRASHV